MGKRKRHDPEYIKNKIRRLEKKLKQREEESASSEETSTPLEPHGLPAESEPEPELVQETPTVSTEGALPEEFLLALGHEGEDKEVHGEPINSELALRWTKIMTNGLKKEEKEALISKYLTPSNFGAAVAPIMNKEISASLSEPCLNRDKRIATRQNITGKLMICLAKSLTDILKGNINSKKLIEEINDAAKIAAGMYHTDSGSRNFFSLSNATKTVQETCRETKSGKFLFGENLQEQLKAIETAKRTAQLIKVPESNKTPSKPVNWRSPSQYQPNQRGRGGRQPRRHQPSYQPPRRPPPSRGTPRHATAPRRPYHRRY